MKDPLLSRWASLLQLPAHFCSHKAWLRRVSSLRPQGICYWFSLVSSAPLCVLLFILPHYSFFFCFCSFIFLAFLCLQVPFLLSNIISVCLDIIFLIPGLFLDSGSSSEPYYFNFERKHSGLTLENPFWWLRPKSNNSKDLKRYRVSSLKHHGQEHYDAE